MYPFSVKISCLPLQKYVTLFAISLSDPPVAFRMGDHISTRPSLEDAGVSRSSEVSSTY
jgi:hypothetical protein